MAEFRNITFAQLYSESRAALRRYVLRLTGSREVADEIVQEAFLRTYEHRAILGTPRAFLFTTARNLAADIHRRKRFATSYAVGEIAKSSVVVDGNSLESQALSDEQHRMIREAVDRLPAKCRAAFVLRVFHWLSYKEIAERLGIAVRTVEKHIARGLHETHLHLRRRYGEDAGHHG